MLVVNLFGAPGTGKSTGATYVFAMLKIYGINAELVTEAAKDMVWDGNTQALDNQIYIFGEQFNRIKRLDGKVDVVVTDSPTLLSCLYGKQDEPYRNTLNQLIVDVSNSDNTINALIERVKPYNPIGRVQTEEESDDIAASIIQLLDDTGTSYQRYPGSLDGYNGLVGDILDYLDRS